MMKLPFSTNAGVSYYQDRDGTYWRHVDDEHGSLLAPWDTIDRDWGLWRQGLPGDDWCVIIKVQPLDDWRPSWAVMVRAG